MAQQIYHTITYELFCWPPMGRPVDKELVGRFKIQYESAGHLRRRVMIDSITPVFVTEDFEILDGQYRFSICQTVGVPVPYSIVPRGEEKSFLQTPRYRYNSTKWHWWHYIRALLNK